MPDRTEIPDYDLLELQPEHHRRITRFLGNVAMEIGTDSEQYYGTDQCLSDEDLIAQAQDLVALVSAIPPNKNWSKARLAEAAEYVDYVAGGLSPREIEQKNNRFKTSSHTRRYESLLRLIKEDIRPSGKVVSGWDFSAPLLEPHEEVDLAKTIEAGVFAGRILAQYEVGSTALPTTIAGRKLTEDQKLRIEADSLAMPQIVDKYITGDPETKAQSVLELEQIKQQGELALERFIQSNIRYAYFRMIQKLPAIRAGGISNLNEIMPEAVHGLLTAIIRFDHTRIDYENDKRFVVFAYHWINNAIYEAIVARQPINRTHYWDMITVRKVENAQSQSQNEVDDDTIAALCTAQRSKKFSPQYVKNLRILYRQVRGAVSLYQAVDSSQDEDGSFLDHLSTVASEGPEPPDIVVLQEQTTKVRSALEQLTTRERLVIGSRFGIYGEAMTRGELRTVLQVSDSTISELVKSSYKKLRLLLRDKAED